MALPAVRAAGTPSRWDPFREFDELVNTVFSGPGGTRVWSPLADVSETDDAYLVEVDLPGAKREDIALDLVGTTLAINGELKEKEREGWFRHRTRRTGQFQYRVTLPRNVEADKIEAALEEGVLTVRIPKSEATRPRRIEISGK
jgi:HSP20 family protein